jgi:O-antigen ligase
MHKPIAEQSLDDFNKPALMRLIAVAFLITSVLIVYLSLTEHYLFLLALAAAPLIVLVVTQPRLALYQYVFILFIEYTVVPSVPLTIMDVSAALVILAALLDVLSGDSLPKYLPRLSFNYLYIIAALIVCGFLGYWPELAVRRVARAVMILSSFLAVYHLAGKVTIARLIKLFFVLSVVHSICALIPFLASGGTYRSFAFTKTSFDDITMVALPIGLALYLSAIRARSGFYLLGSVVILGGLTATQSRAPIVIGIASALIVLLTAHAVMKNETPMEFRRILRRRIRLIGLIGVALTILILLSASGVMTEVFNRFGELFSAESRSLSWRLYLWEKALIAFREHPIFGVGPDGYKRLEQVYSSLRFTPASYLLRSLTAHNLFLYFLAETGLVGAIGIVALMFNQFRLALMGRSHPYEKLAGIRLVLYAWAIVFSLSTLVEAGWMWGQLSFLAVFFAALVSRQHTIVTQSQK